MKTFLGNIQKEFHLIAEAATGGVLYKKIFLKTRKISTGKHPCQSLLFNKIAGLSFLRTPFLQNTFGSFPL